MPVGLRHIGFAAVQPRTCFQARRVDTHPTVPLSELSGSSPRARDPLQSSFALTPAHDPFGTRLLPGFHPSSRHHRVRPLASRVPKSSIRSVRRRSQPLDGFLRTPASRACYIPQPRPGYLCSFRGLPSPRSRRFPHRNRAAPLPLFAGRSPEQVLESTCRRPRLRGLRPRGARTTEGW